MVMYFTPKMEHFPTLVVTILCTGIIAAGNENPPSLAEVSKANNLFAKDLYQALRKSDGGSLICSPLSLSAVIAMVKAGARGKTAEEIQTTLYFPKDETLFSGYSALLESLKSNDNFTLEMANRIYSASGFELNPAFVKIISDSFRAEIEQLDFTQSETASGKINEWVEQVTRSKITNLISPSDLNALTRLVLVNGIYFKGQWKTQFDSKKTHKGKFYTDATNAVEVDMMDIEAKFHIADLSEELNAKAISLPYSGDRLSMVILLPNSIDGLKDLESKLNTFDMNSLASKFVERKTHLLMPKFKLESTLDLKDPLIKLGLSSMFDQSSADFSGIPKNPQHESLFISKAIQKAFIEVNEEGSEAAAATGLQIQLKSSSFSSQFTMEHPFMAFIHDKDNKAYLFMTAVENPLQEKTVLKSTMAAISSPHEDNNSAVEAKTRWSLLSLGLLYTLQRAL